MTLEFTLYSGPLYIELPIGLIGWLGWLALLGVDIALLRSGWGYNKKWTKREWGIFISIAVLVPITGLFLVLHLPPGDSLPPPGRPVEPTGPALVLLSAVPWVLAAGFLGPAPAALLALLPGLALALWDTHSPFTPLETSLLAILLGACLHQRYRTIPYRLLRHPLVSTVLLLFLYLFLSLVDTLFATNGSLVSRLDYALNHTTLASLAIAGPMLMAGLVVEIIASAAPSSWGRSGPLVPSPYERKLETRFLYTTLPLTLLLALMLIVGDWLVAGNAARQMLRERMANSARVASDTIPFFLETGQNFIQQLAGDPALLTADPGRLQEVLAQDLKTVPFFRQLFFMDETGNAVTGYPLPIYLNSYPSPEELTGIDVALRGVPVQNYTVPPVGGEGAAQVSFLAAIMDEAQNVRGVLIGRTDLASNPFTQPVLASLRETVGSDGEGMLLDAQGRILYHPNSNRLMEVYTGKVGEQPFFYDDTAPDGTRRLVYFQPVLGHPWSVVLTIPARRTQQMALNIAVPLLVILVLLFAVAVLVVRFGLRLVTSSLKTLSAEANRISGGQLDHPMLVTGEDEVGQLRRAFEHMRVSLKSRMDELNRLLTVSQGIASSLEVEEAVRPVLDAALTVGACSARVVLAAAAIPEAMEDASLPASFGAGLSTDLFITLDDQVMELTRQQERVILTNPARARLLKLPTGLTRPEAIIALALRHESLYYGTLWLAYDRPHQFSDDEVRFLTTLAGQAALAAANARLFQSAELGRQRLAAILASTPDPVLVTDQQNRLLLANPAALTVLGLGIDASVGQPIGQLISQIEMIKLLRSSADEMQSAEIMLSGGRIYLATASTVLNDGQRAGRVCVLRDITQFKELDAMKSEFVATVSHDLRSPLTLMRGYATMLEMVGELNEQQVGYVRKIATAVESMSRLVNNLLDLGRIEAGVDLQLEMVVVHDVVERVAGSLQLQATQKKVQLQVEIPTQTVPLIEADQALLQQALYNLVENAVKYTDSGGKISVTVTAREEGLVFQVSDTGIGIAPVDQPRLFEKFYRGSQRDGKRQHGSGLGLAIVKSIAERHGGRVWLESQLGKGSTFYLLVPLRQPDRELKNLRLKQKV
jgi:PAS domain S-box-containing protein